MPWFWEIPGGTAAVFLATMTGAGLMLSLLWHSCRTPNEPETSAKPDPNESASRNASRAGSTRQKKTGAAENEAASSLDRARNAFADGQWEQVRDELQKAAYDATDPQHRETVATIAYELRRAIAGNPKYPDGLPVTMPEPDENSKGDQLQ